MTRDDDRPPPWRRYLRLTRSDGASDVDDELAFHLQSTIDEYLTAGMTREEATNAAREKFGDVDDISRTLYTLSEQRERTMDRGDWWASVEQDVVFALRQLRKSAGFTTVALLTLALGIGANSAIFSVVNAVLLSPLPFANSARIMSIYELRSNGDGNVATFGNFVTWRAQAKSFDALAAYWTGAGNKTLTGTGEPVRLNGTLTTADYWKVFSIKPVIGSYFTDDDAREGAAPVVVLSAALWENKFNRDRSIIGKTITLNGLPTRIVGVAPQDYILDGAAEAIWSPLVITAARAADHSDHELMVAGLVKSGVTLEQATSELSRIERQLAVEYPHAGFEDIRAFPFAQSVIGDVGKTIYMLFGAVALVLLIACANVANLLIARAARRRGEMAVRGALGASRSRIMRQLFVESLVLAVAGGALGLVVAFAGIRFLVTSPASVPRLRNASLSPLVVAFTMSLALGCAVLFGLVPSLRASRTDLQQTLRDGGRESMTTSRDAFRAALVIGELCLAQVLLVGAALLVRSMLLMSSVPLGFDTHNLLALSVALPSSRYQDHQRIDAGFQQIEAAISAVPGVKSVGRTLVAPIYSNGWSWTAMREGSNGHDEGAVSAEMRAVSPNYFRAIAVPLVRGRAFTVADAPNAPLTAIVSRSLARHLFGDADPIGRRISNGSVENPNWREIVGVAEDLRANGPKNDPMPTLYLPSSVFVNPSQTFVVRGNVPVLTLVPQIRRAVATVDPLLPLSNPSTIDAALGRMLAMPRFTALLLTLLGVTGLVLAVVGVYGVVSYFVTQRTHEFGVRLALGASPGAVRSLVVRQGIGLAVVGVLTGVGLAFVASPLLQRMVFGITTHDPITFGGIAGILVVVAIGASYIPARRATRIDPLEALRSS